MFKKLTPIALFALLAGCAAEQSYEGASEPLPVTPLCTTCGEPEMTNYLTGISSFSAYKHFVALDEIAKANGDTRAAGTPGYDRSLEYVETLLQAKGYTTYRHEFDFIYYKLNDSSFSQTAPNAVVYEKETDFVPKQMSPAGSVVGKVQAVDLDLGPGNNSTSGCEIEDFADFEAGKIALIQRGACTFKLKAQNAEAKGAIAAIIFNQGNTDTRVEPFPGTLSLDTLDEVTIPVISTSYALGEQFAEMPDLELAISVDATLEIKTTENLLAETPGGDENNVVMLGAHLDSVADGPGINDNGSGTVGILEAALQFPDINNLNNKLRFAWWGAEELGLVGSTKYVESLDEEAKSKIGLYLNFDMIASPNFMLGVYDGDGSSFGSAGPRGSDKIEWEILNFIEYRSGKPATQVQSTGRSDYVAFAQAGIPYGGLFTGAEDQKTRDMADVYGGAAGVAFDVCYHKDCDKLSELERSMSSEALDINMDVVAFLALTYSRSTATVEGRVNVPRLASKGPDGGATIGHDHSHSDVD